VAIHVIFFTITITPPKKPVFIVLFYYYLLGFEQCKTTMFKEARSFVESTWMRTSTLKILVEAAGCYY